MRTCIRGEDHAQTCNVRSRLLVDNRRGVCRRHCFARDGLASRRGAWANLSYPQCTRQGRLCVAFRMTAPSQVVPRTRGPPSDYGASQGKNSLMPLRVHQSISGSAGPERPILVYHQDLPANDFNALWSGHVSVRASGKHGARATWRLCPGINDEANCLAILSAVYYARNLSDKVSVRQGPKHRGGSHAKSHSERDHDQL